MENLVSEAIILAGGKGTRLRSVTKNLIPKCMTPISGMTIIEWELHWLAREGISRVIVAIGHFANELIKYLPQSYETPFGNVQVIFSEEKEKLGSGGALKQAAAYINSACFLVMNGDILTNVSLQPLFNIHFTNSATASMLLVNMTSPYGVVSIEDSKITSFIEKPRLDVPIHAGIDLINSNIVSRFPDKGQMEDTIFLELTEEGTFYSYLMDNNCYWQSIDTEKDFMIANEKWKFSLLD